MAQTIRGFLRYEPEMRFTSSGKAITTFPIYKYLYSTEEDKDIGQRIITWENLAEQCNRILQSGSEIFLSGYYKTRTWENHERKTISRQEFTAQKVWLVEGTGLNEQFTDIEEIGL